MTAHWGTQESKAGNSQCMHVAVLQQQRTNCDTS